MKALERLITITQSHVDRYKSEKEKPETYWSHVRNLIQLQCQRIKLKYHG